MSDVDATLGSSRHPTTPNRLPELSLLISPFLHLAATDNPKINTDTHLATGKCIKPIEFSNSVPRSHAVHIVRRH